MFIVHPPVGKWLIALGEKAFGMDPFGWRVAAAITGPARVCSSPVGTVEEMCSAYAVSGRPCTSSRPSPTFAVSSMICVHLPLMI